MISGRDRSYHVNPWPPKDGVIGGLDIKDTKICDDVERTRVDWELHYSGGTSFAPVEIVEEWLSDVI